MIFAAFFAACATDTADTADTAEEAVASPTLAWLSPSEGDTFAAGDVACSMVIDAFTLQDPAKHGEGEPVGYIAVSVDAAEVLQTGATTFTLPLEAGAHTLAAALFYADGDEVSATADRLCEEDDTDTTCAPVAASIAVTVE